MKFSLQNSEVNNNGKTSTVFIDRKIYGKIIVLDSGKRERGNRKLFYKRCRRVYLNSLFLVRGLVCHRQV